MPANRDVTDKDVRLFKTTLLARRFPGLKGLKEEEVKRIIVEQKNTNNWVPNDRVRTWPKTQPPAVTPKRLLESEMGLEPPQAPFRPVSPSRAKQTILMPPEQAFVMMYSPYSADHEDYLNARISDQRKHVSHHPFQPTCFSQAREAIKVKYYLNSPIDSSQLTVKEAYAVGHTSKKDLEEILNRLMTVADINSLAPAPHESHDREVEQQSICAGETTHMPIFQAEL